MASFALFVFAFLALTSQQTLVTADLIETTCGKSTNKEVCQATFAANPASKNADLNGLAIIALDAAVKQGKDIELVIVDLSKTVDADSNKRLIDCSNKYQQAIVELGKAKSALEFKRHSDLNTVAIAAVADGETCMDGFRELPGGSSPIEEMTDKFEAICSIVEAIASELSGKT